MLALAIGSGLVSCLYVVAIVRRRGWIALGLAAQFGLIFVIDRFFPAGSGPGPGGPAIEAIRSQAVFDAMGCLFAAIAGQGGGHPVPDGARDTA